MRGDVDRQVAMLTAITPDDKVPKDHPIREIKPFPARALQDSYVPRLWATRKIGFLLNSVRFNALTDEVVEEIVALSKQFGIITPYTSFLVEEPGQTMEEAAQGFRRTAVPELSPAAGAPVTGSSAFDTARKVADYARADSFSDAAEANGATVRTAAGKTFFLDDGVWTDTAYGGGPTVKIGFAGENYFEILRKRPDWGAYFALGERVLFVSQSRAYEVAPGDFPPVDVPARPEPAEEAALTVSVPEQEPSGRSLPWPFLIGGGAAAAVLLGGAGFWVRRWQRGVAV